MTVKDIPLTVMLSCSVLLVFVGLTVYLHPWESLAVALGVMLCAAAIRVAYFVIEGE